MRAAAQRIGALCWIAIFFCVQSSFIAPLQAADTVRIFAAASLKTVLDRAAQDYQGKAGVEIRISYAASSTLARQIEQGAPADIFASADEEWMDHVEAKGSLRQGLRVNLLGNKLVMIAPKISSANEVSLTPEGILKALGEGRLATGDVNSVPAGKYARQALETLGLWQVVRSRIAGAENVRAALAFVARGEAPLGIVYATDAAAEPLVKVVARFPVISHKPIIYPFALTKNAIPAASAFLEYLQSANAARFFEEAGFTVLAKPNK